MIWPIGYSKSKTFIMNFFMFFVEFSSCIPVSLIVTIEIAKTAQSYFIDFDQFMYSDWRKRKVFARIANLNEELGQVEYVFCDKTGTLTKNQLTFHTAVVGNQFYEFQYNLENKQYSCEAFTNDLNSRRRDGSTLQGSQVWQGQHLKSMEDYLLCLLFCNSISTI
jgi:P-type E1-E2 ATPase